MQILILDVVNNKDPLPVMGVATEAGFLVRQCMRAGGYKYRISYVLVDHSRVRQQHTEHQVLSSHFESGTQNCM